MATDTDEGSTLQSQLEGLQERLSRLRRAGIFIGLTLLAILAFRDYPGRTLKAREFLLCDAKGNVRARLAVTRENDQSVSSFQLLDASGKPSVTFASSESGTGRLKFYNPEGSTRLELVSDGTGPGLTLYSNLGKPRLWVGILGDSPSVELIDSNGSPRARLAMKADTPFLKISDVEGNTQAQLPRMKSARAARGERERASVKMENSEPDTGIVRRSPPGMLGG